MTGGQDHSGDAVRQRLAEISETLGDSLADMKDVKVARDKVVAALTAVLDRHAEDLHDARFKGYCQACGNEFPCPDYRAVAAALEEQP